VIPEGRPPDPAPHPLIYWGDLSVTGNGDLPLATHRRVEGIASEATGAGNRVKSQIEASDALLFVTPEHNRSLPTALKNVLDWVSRPYGKNLWAGKPAGMVGASVGMIGTAVVQAHLRSVLGYLDLPTLGQPEVCLYPLYSGSDRRRG
jgi:NAD(P)H-dependent FMN reductase